MPVLRMFPLNSVVFPSQRLPLHIFEPRYRQLVRETLDGDSVFGIVLIETGREVAGDAVPVDVGCAVRIVRSDELPDGRFNISCKGIQRFRILELLGNDPYLRAEVEFLGLPDDANDEATQELSEETADAFCDYLHMLLALHDGWQRRFRLPQRPAALADYAAGHLEIAAQLKQKILEAPRVSDRLELILRILRTENSQLAERVVVQRRQKLAGLGALN